MGQLEAVNRASFTRDGLRFLPRTLRQETYGGETLEVQEIPGYSAIRPIPNAPSHVRDAMNLRGAIVPVVDLHLRSGMAEAEHAQLAAIIVVTVGARTGGVVVDGVSDVLDMARADSQDTPDLSVRAGASAINGIARAGERMVALPDIDRALGGEALGSRN